MSDDKCDASSVGYALTSSPDVTAIAFISIALYNVVELTVIIYSTFKRRRGLYFWSFCVATWGIPPYSIGFLLINLGIRRPALYAAVAMIAVGWSCTVTGQSVVLYSRLHLVDRNPRHLRLVLAVIVVNGLVLHPVTTVMVFGANSGPGSAQHFRRPYSVIEKVQVTIFAAQELLISLLYIWAAAHYFRPSASLHPPAAAARDRMIRHLILVNVVVIILDFTILGLEYSDHYQLQTTFKGMAYSIKLKLEFRVLNDLVNITRIHESPAATAATTASAASAAASTSHLPRRISRICTSRAPEPRNTGHDNPHALIRLTSAPPAAGASSSRDFADRTGHAAHHDGRSTLPSRL